MMDARVIGIGFLALFVAGVALLIERLWRGK